MLRSTVLVLVLILATAPCRAGNTFVYSYGLKSCGAFVAATGNNLPGQYATLRTADGRTFSDESETYKNWLFGYLTGVNMMRNPAMPSIELDNEAIDLWMRNWCNAHPTNSVFEGAAALVTEQYDRLK